VLAIPFGTGKFSPITAHDQGRVIASVLSDPHPHSGKTYLLDGPQEMNAAQMAAELSTVLGRPILYVDQPIEEFQATVATIPQLGSYVGQHITGTEAHSDAMPTPTSPHLRRVEQSR
jgi:NAD(P)H dehydrogenase (quinone)